MSRILRSAASACSKLAAPGTAPGLCATCWNGFFPGRAIPSVTHAPAHHVPTPAPFHSRAAASSTSQFERTVLLRFRSVALSQRPWEEIEKEVAPFGIKNMDHLKREEILFIRSLKAVMRRGGSDSSPLGGRSLFDTLRLAYIRGDVKGLSSQLYYLFRNFLLRNRFSKPVNNSQRRLMDLRYPWEWFPATRALHRTIHLHVGPTNSGKTYHALKALENAETGVYCGPLRLLAHEVYTRLTAKGKACALITGEEQRFPEDTDRYFISCTVEMAPLNHILDVAVIDEIQMMADPDRGSSWTAAFLGVQAKEVHLCGEERTVDLVKSICASIGDNCVVHRYNRLTPLKTAPKSLGKRLDKLEKGDCIVSFSRLSIHALKAAVERETGRRCAIIYGSLPPETRTQQAALFNDPNNDYDFLVASDAVGMGLNLDIRRIIFETLTKHDGFDFRDLTVSEIRQIGGRAGRFKTARDAVISSHTTGDGDTATVEKHAKRAAEDEEKVGLVTTLDPADLGGVRSKLWKDAKQIRAAAIVPPVAFIEKFASFFPSDTPLSFILMRIQEVATTSDRFQLCIKDDFLMILDAIQEFPLSISDRLVLMTAPVTLRAYGSREAIRAVARCLSEGRGGHILDMPEIHLEVLDAKPEELTPEMTAIYLSHLESLHHAVVLYLWVSYRFPRIFTAQALAFHVRDLVQQRINDHLASVRFTDEAGAARRFRQRRRADRRMRLRRELLGEQAVDDLSIGEGPGRWNEEGHEEPLTDDPGAIPEDIAPSKREEQSQTQPSA
ncbi:hypothetical protein VUR80DRAFT_10105 [Thermomyces stellatus]